MRTLVLVDVVNMFVGGRETYQSKVDYGRVYDELAKDNDIVRAYAYATTDSRYQHDSFLSVLTKVGFMVRRRETQTVPLRVQYVQATLDAMAFVNRVDRVVLLSGDREFAPLMRHIRALQLETVVHSFERSAHAEMQSAPDKFHLIPASWCFPPESKPFDKVVTAPAGTPATLGSTAPGRVDMAALPNV